MTRDLTQIEGSCHCRNIRYVLLRPGAISDIPVRCCGCTFCKKHGGAWTSNPDSELTVKISDIATVSRYEFGTKTAEFYVCSTCGVAPLVVSEIDGNQYAVVNVNTFENIDTSSLSTAAANFDGEVKGDRLERRKRNWIPSVTVTATTS